MESMVATDYPMVEIATNPKVLQEKLKKWSQSFFSNSTSNMETSKVRSPDTTADADWSGLPKDLLQSICERLCIVDYLRFSAVCTYWRSIAVFPRIMLMVHNKEEPDIGNLCSLSSINDLHNPLRNIKYEMYYGSLNGFMIKSSDWAGSKQGEIHLYNPVSGGRISLPSLPGTIPPIHIEKAIVASASNSTDDFIVVVSIWFSNDILFCREGDEEWSWIVTRKYPMSLIDITYHQCKLYAIFSEAIEVYDLQIRKCNKHCLIIKTTFPDSSFFELQKRSKRFRRDDRYYQVYLVTTPKEELLMVTKHTPSTGAYRTMTFKVLKLCEDDGSWYEVQSLGDQVLFLGKNSVCLMAHDVPECEANSIYFISSSTEFNGKCDTAAATAIAAVSSTLSSLHLSQSLFFFTKPSSFPSRNFKTFSLIRASSSSKTEFNITFGTGTKESLKPNPLSEKSENPNTPSIPFLIPWIVRGEDGKLKLQSTPPVHLLHDIANAKTTSTTPKKKKKAISSDKPVLKVEPKYSKAARRFYNENFRDPPQRLSKVLAASGVASRRSSEALIFEGRVTVNGSVCNTPQTRVDPGRDIIYVNGNRISKKLPPKNKINQGFPKPRLFTVGRLDVATTGLIVITNDGDFAQKISHPSSGLSKEYIAAIDGVVNKRHLVAISQGTAVEGVHCKPDSVELLPQQPDVSRPRLRIVVGCTFLVHEGRNHEVRELVKHAGLVLYSLKRVRIGGYRLPSDLGLGKYIELKQGDLKSLGGTV
ncbi:hypothetical protein AQUCO_03000068v1 [Aquilegia coerulea]|uniref:RNA-binding S4 domain-containing protein n=1 Tax=Aquilegia coerulea TaxID=218851 RepID=A0A2G5D129_AQUCA|nr:hypothetical protein AQUCO_03000068v1 [Aquilegia coerulea]